MRHTQQKIPAYKCGPRGQNCQHERKGDHGIHNEVWRYVVVTDDGRAALSVAVGSGIYTPDTHVYWPNDDKPEGYDMQLHVAFPTDRESVKRGAPKCHCDYLPGGLCHSAWGGSAADLVKEWFDKRSGYEQPRSFWYALEQKLTDLLKEYRDASVEWGRCSHCDGEGTVPR